MLKGNTVNPELITVIKNSYTCAVWSTGNGSKAALYRLGTACKCMGFCLRFGATERWPIMTTTQNPSCVCDTLHTSPVDPAFQLATSLADLIPDQEDKSSEPQEKAGSHSWPVMFVDVPYGWKPERPDEFPPGARRFSDAKVASEMAARLNRKILNKSNGEPVESWHIRINRGKDKQAVVLAAIPERHQWRPSSVFDVPEGEFTLNGGVSDVKRELAEFNERLAEQPGGIWHRAYVALSLALDVSNASLPQGKQPNHSEGLPVYLVDIPADYRPFSWKSLPDGAGFQKVNNGEAAMMAALHGNQRIYDKAKARPVNAWYVVLRVSGGYGIAQIRGNWCPKDPYDMPQPFVATTQHVKVTKELNQTLDRGTYTKRRKRAYVAIPIDRSIVLKEHQPDDERAKPEQQETADELLKRHGLLLQQADTFKREERETRLNGELR